MKTSRLVSSGVNYYLYLILVLVTCWVGRKGVEGDSMERGLVLIVALPIPTRIHFLSCPAFLQTDPMSVSASESLNQ